ncbi:sugar-binding transcriptional regulator [Marinilactibacillus piezotolerans]|uniref:sugar-binding transcriptional regulator n=1 Tax=Marinilactibacillus piezotolerans TaxID=258723 RepID=UPI0009AF6890|nr:sugar-binding domain-containing protein [Marinilactibacillus piezotolerans]
MLSVIEKVAPDTFQTLKRRYHILKQIQKMGPIGRRTLAARLGYTERVLRSEVDILKQQGLVKTSSIGMECTSSGVEIYRQLERIMGQHVRSKELETRLANALKISHCIIVPGDADEDEQIAQDMGLAAVKALDFLLPAGKSVVAVMGGTTMGEVADAMDEGFGAHRKLLFVPARGGLGESVDIQANMIAEKMARKSGGKSRALYAPEYVRSDTYSLLSEEPEIKETLQLVENASLILYSIGSAFEMAERRGMNTETLQLLKEKNAVAEAFGEFVNPEGEIVYKLSRIGLQSGQMGRIPNVLAVAGGKHKAKAIEAYVKTVPPHTWLVTDEAAANEILNGGTL